jgi:N-acetylglutamate synthase-like GNAT family acetyltransferase
MQFTLRPATQSDQSNIRALIRQVKINPMDLDWRNFTVAVSSTGELIGCGQVRFHNDGSRELASVAVAPDYRHEGIASAIISHLLNISPLPIYLTCRAELEPFYQRFGFHTITEDDMPPYFIRTSRLVGILIKLRRQDDRLLVMMLS